MFTKLGNPDVMAIRTPEVTVPIYFINNPADAKRWANASPDVLPKSADYASLEVRALVMSQLVLVDVALEHQQHLSLAWAGVATGGAWERACHRQS